MREDAILDAAQELLADKGYGSMTLEDVIEAVGISKPTLYQHFASKEELASQVVVRKMTEVRDYLAALDPARSAHDRLGDSITWILHRKYGEPTFRLTDFLHSMRACGHGTPFSPLEQEIAGQIEDLIRQGQGEGSVRNDMSASFLTHVLLSVVRDDKFLSLLRDGHITLPVMTEATLRLILLRP